MELNEKTQLIMNFMEVEEMTSYYDGHGRQVPVYYTCNVFFRTSSYSKPEISLRRFIENARYHDSYDWAMSVVERIESLGYQFKICRRRVEIFDDNTLKQLFYVKMKTKIASIFEGIVWFINWYNGNKN